MAKQLFSIVGRTLENDPVVAGIFRFKESYGMPLVVIFDNLQNRSMVPSWFHLLEEAKKAGVNQEKFMTELEYSIIDIYGMDYWKKVSEIIAMPKRKGR